MRLGTCTPPSPLTGGKATPHPADRLGRLKESLLRASRLLLVRRSAYCQVEGERKSPPITWQVEDLPLFEHSGKLIVGSWPQNSNRPPPHQTLSLLHRGVLADSGRARHGGAQKPADSSPSKALSRSHSQTASQRANRTGTQEPPPLSLHRSRTPRPARRQPAPPGARCQTTPGTPGARCPTKPNIPGEPCPLTPGRCPASQAPAHQTTCHKGGKIRKTDPATPRSRPAPPAASASGSGPSPRPWPWPTGDDGWARCGRPPLRWPN